MEKFGSICRPKIRVIQPLSTKDTRMYWCRFNIDNKSSFGIVKDSKVTKVDGSPFDFYEPTDTHYDLSDVQLLVPVIPNTFYAIGSNYKDHILKRSVIKGTPPKFYDQPRVGYRANSALIATHENIIKPKDAGSEFQYEGELVVVIGKRGKNLTPEQAKDCIFGWTIGNDISERTWQKQDPTNLRGKNADTFKPMGPWISTEIDLDHRRTTVRLNDKVVHDFATGNMLFSPYEVISSISKYNTLSPGDVIWLGTDELPLNLKDGDSLEIEISGIGTLKNTVVLEK